MAAIVAADRVEGEGEDDEEEDELDDDDDDELDGFESVVLFVFVVGM